MVSEKSSIQSLAMLAGLLCCCKFLIVTKYAEYPETMNNLRANMELLS